MGSWIESYFPTLYMLQALKVLIIGLCDETGYMDSGQLNDNFEKCKSWLIPRIKDSSGKCISSSFSFFSFQMLILFDHFE